MSMSEVLKNCVALAIAISAESVFSQQPQLSDANSMEEVVVTGSYVGRPSQADAIAPGQRVVVVDDLLATGGTMAAAISLLRKVGAEVSAAACIIELSFLAGRDAIDVPITSLIAYDA